MAVLQEYVTKKEINGTEMHIKRATWKKKKSEEYGKSVHIIQDTMNCYALG